MWISHMLPLSLLAPSFEPIFPILSLGLPRARTHCAFSRIPLPFPSPRRACGDLWRGSSRVLCARDGIGNIIIGVITSQTKSRSTKRETYSPPAPLRSLSCARACALIVVRETPAKVDERIRESRTEREGMRIEWRVLQSRAICKRDKPQSLR